ncbi:MAG: hypothetical protein ACXVPY_05610 [Bacteroidia bacterium]
MRSKKIVVPIIFSLVIGVTIFSCTYEKGSITKECDLPTTVSFSQDLLPIFNSQCSISGCHTSATHAGGLNLEPAAAYSALLQSGSGYVDTLNPTFSILYNKLTTTSGPMPPGGALDNCKIKLVLKWIQQKAKNN